MEVKDLVRVFVKGGIISPGEFLKIIHIAEKLGSNKIHFGSRQDIMFSAQNKSKALLDETFSAINTQYEINQFEHQNICSSYVTVDLLPGKKWLASHVYINILDSFNYEPKLRINIVDPSQGLVPLFTGNINFIASGLDNYWYIYLRFKKLLPTPWQVPVLVYSDDIPKVAQAIEQMDIEEQHLDYQTVGKKLVDEVNMNYQPVTEELVLPDTIFPYYEGINRMSDGKYWLGLYWRDNCYSTTILKAICEKCLSTEVGKICLTPWKSFVIKGIFEKDRVGWEKLMGKFGMNLRHSALEMNWHLPALDQEALDLKIYLVRTLDQQDISTYGLTFTIKSSDDITLFTSIVIEKCPDQVGGATVYNILYSKDFNPNSGEYRTYAKAVNKEVIAPLLIELSRQYYDQLEEVVHEEKTQAHINLQENSLYQCSGCMTIYDEKYGDTQSNIPSGTPFNSLPKNYECPVCGGSKSGFQKMA